MRRKRQELWPVSLLCLYDKIQPKHGCCNSRHPGCLVSTSPWIGMGLDSVGSWVCRLCLCPAVALALSGSCVCWPLFLCRSASGWGAAPQGFLLSCPWEGAFSSRFPCLVGWLCNMVTQPPCLLSAGGSRNIVTIPQLNGTSSDMTLSVPRPLLLVGTLVGASFCGFGGDGNDRGV